jgi:hypothetical protein
MVQSKISRCTGHTLLRTDDSSTLLFDVFSLFPHRSSEHILCNASEIDPGGFFSDLALDTVTRYLSSERDLICCVREAKAMGDAGHDSYREMSAGYRAVLLVLEQ